MILMIMITSLRSPALRPPQRSLPTHSSSRHRHRQVHYPRAHRQGQGHHFH